jgi:dihydrofolate synthase/folylpolyglutamate synthase
MAATGGSAEYEAAVEALFALKPQGPKLGLDRMRLLVEELGHPERTLNFVHVGGTNGKGSVAAMIEAILREAGFTVGLYTSPHLVDVAERVQLNRRKLTPAELLGLLDDLQPVREAIARRHGVADAPSFFELMTAMGLLSFQRHRCDLAVMEVGMGGEFDATNVIRPEVSVITSVGLDHCEWLGHTVEAIARTKAGIIKPRRPVVIGRMPRVAETVIREIASWHEAPVHSVRDVFGDELENYPTTNLAGDYQRWNAGAAVLAVRALGPRWKVAAETVDAALARVTWAGRWQRLTIGSRTVILDASHNADGAGALDGHLRQLLAAGERKPIIVIGVLGRDRAKALLPVVARYAGELHLVTPDDARAVPQDELAALLPAGGDFPVRRARVGELFPGPGDCRVGVPGDTVIVTGSIHLLGEVLGRLQLPAV